MSRVDATTLGGFGPAEEWRPGGRAGMRLSFHEQPEVHQHLAFGLGLADHVEVFPTDRPFDCAHMLIREPAFDRIAGGKLSLPTARGPASSWRTRRGEIRNGAGA
jgi:hypothetical protein